MPVRIVTDVPVPDGAALRGFGRFLAVVAGIVLLVVGFVAAFWPVLYVVLSVSELVEGHVDVKADDVRLVAICCGVSIAGFLLGRKLIRGRRRVGLYLRKFGFAETTRTVSNALNSAVGRSVRLVTLDDDVAQPMGAGAGRRRASSLIWTMAVVCIGLLLFYIFGGGFDHMLADATRSGQSDDPVRAIGASILGAVVAYLFLLLIIMVIVVLFMIGFIGNRIHAATRRAERAASRMMTHEGAVTPMARDIAAQGRRIIAPRLVVIRVPTPFWQRAVHGLAAAVDLVVIDVSQPTDALVWEVRNIKPMFAGRWVLVGARDRVAALADPAVALAGTPQGLVARMLDGEEVIAYGPSPDEQRRFVAALRNRLAQLRWG